MEELILRGRAQGATEAQAITENIHLDMKITTVFLFKLDGVLQKDLSRLWKLV